MTRNRPDETTLGEAERMARTSDEARSGWSQTLEDMAAMAEDREAAGYEVLTLQAGNTAPKGPEQGETERWGLFYVIPGEDADTFQDLLERADFEETGVYQQSIGRYTFIVTECIDHEAELDLLIAGSYRRRAAPDLVRSALDREGMYTHVTKLDGTHLGSVEHEDASAFFPNPDSIFAYEQSL
jgi:hypothetical protein